LHRSSTLSDPKRSIPESRHVEALEGKQDNEAMRESYRKPAVRKSRSAVTSLLSGAIPRSNERMISTGSYPCG
jgi:hypothetical protein